MRALQFFTRLPPARDPTRVRECAAQAWAKTIIPQGEAYTTHRFEVVTGLLRRLLGSHVYTDDARGFFDWLESTDPFPDNAALALQVNQLVKQASGTQGVFNMEEREATNVKEAKMWLFTTMTAPNQAARIRVGRSTSRWTIAERTGAGLIAPPPGGLHAGWW